MTCDAMWILASAQSTSEPFIQILPVPGKAINYSFAEDTRGGLTKAGTMLKPTDLNILVCAQNCQFPMVRSLLFIAERAAIRARVQRLAAVPAETRGRRLARAQPALD